MYSISLVSSIVHGWLCREDQCKYYAWFVMYRQPDRTPLPPVLKRGGKTALSCAVDLTAHKMKEELKAVTPTIRDTTTDTRILYCKTYLPNKTCMKLQLVENCCSQGIYILSADKANSCTFCETQVSLRPSKGYRHCDIPVPHATPLP